MKCYLILVVLFTCLLFQACTTNSTSIQKEASIQIDTNTNLFFVSNVYQNTLDTGFVFHEDTLYFKNIKFTGFAFRLFPSKDTAFIGGYLNGLEEGVHKKWYVNKQIAEKRFYHQGKKISKHIGYWESGIQKFEFNFLNGEHHGLAKEWYRNGKSYKFFNYNNGYEEGSQKMWWENGVIRANYVVKNGRRYGLIGLKLCMNPRDSIIKRIK